MYLTCSCSLCFFSHTPELQSSQPLARIKQTYVGPEKGTYLPVIHLRQDKYPMRLFTPSIQITIVLHNIYSGRGDNFETGHEVATMVIERPHRTGRMLGGRESGAMQVRMPASSARPSSRSTYMTRNGSLRCVVRSTGSQGRAAFDWGGVWGGFWTKDLTGFFVRTLSLFLEPTHRLGGADRRRDGMDHETGVVSG